MYMYNVHLYMYRYCNVLDCGNVHFIAVLEVMWHMRTLNSVHRLLKLWTTIAMSMFSTMTFLGVRFCFVHVCYRYICTCFVCYRYICTCTCIVSPPLLWWVNDYDDTSKGRWSFAGMVERDRSLQLRTGTFLVYACDVVPTQ